MLIALLYGGPIKASLDIFDIMNDVQKKTVFYNKAAPQITCVIKNISKECYSKPKVILTVIYPDGGTCELVTTVGEFKKLWLILE